MSNNKEEIKRKIELKKQKEIVENKPKFFVFSEFGEVCDVALHLQEVEECEVQWHIENADYHKIGEGMLESAKHWYRRLGEGYTWLVDGTSTGKFQTWLRDQGEYVFGSSYAGAKYEDNRQLGQDLFERMGLLQPYSENFTDIDDAIEFATDWYAEKKGKLILKQNGSAPKSVNYKGKFDSGEDFLYHLEELKKSWNEVEYGQFDCDIMEQVQGTEIAISAFYNGHAFLKDETGKVAAFINFEHKKEGDKNLGQTTGETGTIFLTANADNKLVKQIFENEELLETLSELDFRGVFDINGCLTKDGYVGFETTMRPGIPSSSWEFLSGAGMVTKTSELIDIVAKGLDTPIKLTPGWGIVIVVTAKPFPVEADLENSATSIGERLWIIKDGKIKDEFDDEQRKHIHLENFYKDDDGNYRVATKNGYLLTVTMKGQSIKDAREKCMKYIKDNIYLCDMKWRTDIGEEYEGLKF